MTIFCHFTIKNLDKYLDILYIVNMRKIIALWLILAPILSNAEVYLLNKGQPAPVDGFLFDRKSEEENRAKLLTGDLNRQLYE
jgi:hypothetical protein